MNAVSSVAGCLSRVRQALEVGPNGGNPEELRTLRAAVLALERSSVSHDDAHELRCRSHESFKQCAALRCDDDDDKGSAQQARFRALCLAVYEKLGRVDESEEQCAIAKEWLKVATTFMVVDNPGESRCCLDAASSLLGRAPPEDPAVIEARCRLNATEAQLQWILGHPRATIEVLEDTRAYMDSLNGRCPASARLFLADNVALALASAGLQDEQEDGGDADGPTDRRLLVTLTDLSITLLGENHDKISLRDRAVRLKAWLLIQEDELDAAAEALQGHSAARQSGDAGDPCDGGAGDEHPTHMLLRLALLLKTSQEDEARRRAVKWAASDRTLSFESIRDTSELLCQHNCGSAALEVVNAILSGRLVDGASSALYSDVVELKHRLLTQGAQSDSAAAAEHLEFVIDGHKTGRAPATPEALQRFARKLWHAGCLHADSGETHRAIEVVEQANRFLEASGDDNSQLITTLVTLAHFYLSQNLFDKAVARAARALQLLRQHHEPSASSQEEAARRLFNPDASIQLVGDNNPSALAHMVLIKAYLQLGETEQALHHVDGLLKGELRQDHLLVAAICEDVVEIHPGDKSIVIKLMEGFIAQLDNAPPSTGERNKLAGALRTLMTYREEQSAAAGGAEASAARGMILADLNLIVKRVRTLGLSAVCDDSKHIEWLAECAWRQGVACARLGMKDSPARSGSDEAVAALTNAVEFCKLHCSLKQSLSATDERCLEMLRAHSVIVKCCLRLHDSVVPAETLMGAAAPSPHLKSAADAMEAAFRLKQRCQPAEIVRPASGTAPSVAPQHFDAEKSCLLLNFELAVRRDDRASLNTTLSRCVEQSFGVDSFLIMAELSKRQGNRFAEKATLGEAMNQLRRAEPSDYATMGLVQRKMIHSCLDRREQLPHFQEMAEVLSSRFSSANCPLEAETLQWFLASSYNQAVAYFGDSEHDLAESWFAVAFQFMHVSPPQLQAVRDDLMHSYELVLKEVDAKSGRDEGDSSFYRRMRARVTAPSREPDVESDPA